ncbi:MAG: hypothetical protein J6V72_15620 [Kiritimatiellae bacterium]|nr:hypothetical protein [Kiritimatiellia bacterium]
MTTEELETIVSEHEMQWFELKESFGVECVETACAFTNDMPDSKQNGYLLVGTFDDGTLSGLKATDSVLKNMISVLTDCRIEQICYDRINCI